MGRIDIYHSDGNFPKNFLNSLLKYLLSKNPTIGVATGFGMAPGNGQPYNVIFHGTATLGQGPK